MKVSIIVPCYNAANVLYKCVSSILEQSFKDWELLLIDDGSTDETPSLCQSLKNKDYRIHYFRQNNTGVSSARNTGLDLASGDFVTFIDADDYIDPFYLEELLQASSSDFIISGFLLDGQKRVVSDKHIWEINKVGTEIKEIVENDFLLYTPWAKLFNMSVIKSNKLRFDRKMRLGEDTIFCYNYLLHCKSICVLPYASYYYIGEWGGGKKYQLSYDEVFYLDKSETDAIRNINKSFGCNIDLTYRGWHARFIKDLYIEFTDKDTWELYCKTHGYVNIKSFMQDKKLSCLFWAIIDLELLYKRKMYKDAISQMAQLRSFFTVPFDTINTYTPKMKFLLWNIRHGFYKVNHFCLILLYILKRWIH